MKALPLVLVVVAVLFAETSPLTYTASYNLTVDYVVNGTVTGTCGGKASEALEVGGLTVTRYAMNRRGEVWTVTLSVFPRSITEGEILSTTLTIRASGYPLGSYIPLLQYMNLTTADLPPGTYRYKGNFEVAVREAPHEKVLAGRGTVWWDVRGVSASTTFTYKFDACFNVYARQYKGHASGVGVVKVSFKASPLSPLGPITGIATLLFNNSVVTTIYTSISNSVVIATTTIINSITDSIDKIINVAVAPVKEFVRYLLHFMVKAPSLATPPVTSTKPLELNVWERYEAKNVVEGLAFSENGNLGVASWDGCAYVFDPSGNLLNKVCGGKWMRDASYCCGRFGFVNRDGYAYITDEQGKLLYKVYVGEYYDSAITLAQNGFVACKWSCAYFDFRGEKLWNVEVGYVSNGPSFYKGYWYAADASWNKLLVIEDGRIVKKIGYSERALDTAVCNNYLAVTTVHYLYLYDLSEPAKPRRIWKTGVFNFAFQVAFSPDCKYIAVADLNTHQLKVYDIKGKLVLEKYYGSSNNDRVVSVAWWKDRIAVGLYGGEIYVYKPSGG